MTDVTPAVLDFTNVKERGAYNPKHVTPGDYKGKITAVVDSPTKSENKPQWIFTVVIAKSATASYPYRCQLDEKTLWKVRNLFIAAGMNVPKKKVRVDPTKVVGKEIGITLEDHEYENKLSSEIVAVFPVSDLPATDSSPASDDDVETVDESGGEEPAADDGEVEEIEIDEI